MSERSPQCAACPFKQPERMCVKADGKHPDNCPTAHYADLSRQCLEELRSDPQWLRFAHDSSVIECESYQRGEGGLRPASPRIVEIIRFAQRMNYKRLGLIFCMGLRTEAATTLKILEANGFEVVSVVCKIGGVPKAEIGIKPAEQLNPRGTESMCNPFMQAEVCNTMQVDFNVLLGLCVGHDSMVLQRLKAPATVFAVKDRLLGHNPLAALYTCDSYYHFLKKPLE